MIISVVAGKSSAGKSSVCVGIAQGLAYLGKKVLVLELDFGLRCHDILLGVRERASNDIISLGETDVSEAVTKVRSYDNGGELSCVCASRDPFAEVNPDSLIKKLDELKQDFDYIVADSAKIGEGLFSVASESDLVLTVTTPELDCVRESTVLSDYLYVKNQVKNQNNHNNQKLVINKIKKFYKDGEVPDLDEVMDTVGIPLIGAVPDDNNVKLCGAKGIELPAGSQALNEFRAIASRILGNFVPLTIKV